MKKGIFILLLACLFCMAGCANTDRDVKSVPPSTDSTAIHDLDNYMASIKEQSDAIRNFLESDIVTQIEMNEKSLELYELWDEALNYLWDKLKISLPEDEFANLLDEQLVWITEKENASKEAGKEFEGESIYPLVVNSTAAALTEERVYELYEILKSSIS